MSRTPLEPLPVPPGLGALTVRPALRAALDGTGPALAPHRAGSAPPPGPAVAAADAQAATVPDDLALVVGTSGSTGHPKRAMLTRSALRASADATHQRLGGPGQWVLAMPAHHIAGIQVLVRSLVAGIDPLAVDVTGHFDAAAFARTTAGLDRGCARHYTALVPTQLVRLLDDPLGVQALRRYDAVLLGGAASPAALLTRARQAGVAVVTTYGMSETAGGCVYDGEPLPGSRVRLTDDGRILLGGPTLAAGYLAEPALTAAAFATDPVHGRTFRTDDLGRFDADGRLVVEGRVDDLINTGGAKVAPRLVEEALLDGPGGVREAVVVGSPDPEWGQIVCAAVVVADGHPPLTTADARAGLRGVLPDHALPRRVVTLTAIPLRGPGKPDRAAIRALCTEPP